MTTVSLGEPTEVTGEYDPGGRVVDARPRRIGTIPLEVDLRNTGDKPLSVASVEVDVLASTRLDRCGTTTRAGTGRIGAVYTVRLPVADVDGQPAPKPGVVNTPSDFTLDGGETDWMEITVGPDSQSDVVAQLFAYRPALVLDDGSRIVLPSVATISSTGIVGRYLAAAKTAAPNAAVKKCAAEAVDRIDEAARLAQLRTPPLTELRTAYATLAGRR
ncbi:MAG: hypothetical protein QM774_13170 [Gordonia sp. (in: high G+C Gram-positive bacteria)]|uniref:hypothetical protein n=1 Tax=Gordonia sp. (in: high G+C Gram-positive bacteria) TaxID=84139 RepID=UPI0039E41F6F